VNNGRKTYRNRKKRTLNHARSSWKRGIILKIQKILHEAQVNKYTIQKSLKMHRKSFIRRKSERIQNFKKRNRKDSKSRNNHPRIYEN
jgi:ActR/RegA family two-component response regulator